MQPICFPQSSLQNWGKRRELRWKWLWDLPLQPSACCLPDKKGCFSPGNRQPLKTKHTSVLQQRNWLPDTFHSRESTGKSWSVKKFFAINVQFSDCGSEGTRSPRWEDVNVNECCLRLSSHNLEAVVKEQRLSRRAHNDFTFCQRCSVIACAAFRTPVIACKSY